MNYELLRPGLRMAHSDGVDLVDRNLSGDLKVASVDEERRLLIDIIDVVLCY